MQDNINTQKLQNLENVKIRPFVLMVFIIWLVAMGGALEGFNSHSLQINSVQNCILPIVFIFFVIISKFKLHNLKKYWQVFGVLMIWQLMLILKFGHYDFLVGRLYDITFAFVLVRSLGLKKMFLYYEVAVTKLCYLSLIFWIPIVLFPSLKDLLISFSLPINRTGTIVASWGVFGISNSENLGILRNLGFAWEPGRFASFVVLALLIHLFRNRFQLFEKNFWPLLLALFSSLATTGYMAFIICLLGYYMNAKKTSSSQVLKFLLPICFICLFVSSPFMLDKIQSVSNTNTFITDDAANYYGEKDIAYVPQRSEGLFWEWQNILHDPIIGYGDNASYSFVQTVLFPQVVIKLSNGLLQIVSMLGIPLALLFYWSLYKSSSYISKFYNIKGSYLMFLIICAINVSYNFFYEPFIISVVLYSLFLSNTDKERILHIMYEKTHCSGSTV